MANTIMDNVIPQGGFDYGMGTGWIPYLLGMEELPGKEAFQRASVGTDLFKQLTDFMTNPTGGPLGLAATAAYGGPQGISAGTGGRGLPELGGYQSKFDTMLNNLMGYSGGMNAQPEDTKYTPAPIDPNNAPALSPTHAAKAPNSANDLIKAWNAYRVDKPEEQKPLLPEMAFGGIVDMILKGDPSKKKLDEGNSPGASARGTSNGGILHAITGLDVKVEDVAPTPTPTGTPTPTPTTPPGSIKGPTMAGDSGEADPMAAYGGKDLMDAMKKYIADGGNANKFVSTVTAINKLAKMVKEGELILPGKPGQLSGPGGMALPGTVHPDLLAAGPDMIKQMLALYGPKVGYAPGLAAGGGVVVGGSPHFVVDANGKPVAAITEDGKPEAVTGTDKGFEVTPLDPARNAAYNASKTNSGAGMGKAISDAEDFMRRVVEPLIPHAAAGGMFPVNQTYIGDSQASPSGVPAPTTGGPSMTREQQTGAGFSPSGGNLMEQMANIPGGSYNEKYAKLLGGALTKENMAIPGDQLRSLNSGVAPDKLLSSQALSTMSPSQRSGYAAMLMQMGIIRSPEDLDFYVKRFTPDGIG